MIRLILTNWAKRSKEAVELGWFVEWRESAGNSVIYPSRERVVMVLHPVMLSLRRIARTAPLKPLSSTETTMFSLPPPPAHLCAFTIPPLSPLAPSMSLAPARHFRLCAAPADSSLILS